VTEGAQNDPSLLTDWADTLITSGLQDDAALLLEEAVSRHPDQLPIRMALVRALVAEGDRQAAGELVEAALSMPAANKDRAVLLAFRSGFMIDAGRIPASLEAAHDAVRFDPKGAAPLFALAVASWANGREAEARDAVDALLSQGSGPGNARLAAALIELSGGRPDLTAHHLQGPGDPRREGAMSALGDLLLRGARDLDGLRRLPFELTRGRRRQGWRRRWSRRAVRLERSKVWIGTITVGALVATWLHSAGYPVPPFLFPIAIVAWGVVILRIPDERRERKRLKSIPPKRFWAGVAAFVVCFLSAFITFIGIWSAVEGGWGDTPMLPVVISGLIAGLSFWALRRAWWGGTPTSPRGTDPCLGMPALTGRPAQQHALKHLGAKARHTPVAEELLCATSGTRWLRYDITPFGSSSSTSRLVPRRPSGRGENHVDGPSPHASIFGA
jgi:hypothetical protein